MITYYALGTEGRLGNQLWEIASTLGLAYSVNEEVSFPLWEYEPWFCVPSELFGNPHGVDAITLAHSIPPAHRPYLQNIRLWWQIRDLIREYFRESDVAAALIQDRYGHLFEMGPLTAVHVRRTDAVVKQQWFHLPQMEYFDPAMKLVIERGYTTFLVFSDDIAWCRENFPDAIQGCPVLYVSEVLPEPMRNARGDPLGNSSDWQEFFLMKRCVHHVTSNSTFSWWAAWLSGDPEPITPAAWYGPLYRDEINLDNFLLPNWIRV